MKEIIPENPSFDFFEPSETSPYTPAAPPGLDEVSSAGSNSISSLNHFNYFTEVEDEFVRRRGSHLLVSPMDWAVIQTWKDTGVPLHIVLRGINRSFDTYDQRPSKIRKINSLLYCLQEVEACNQEFRESQIGAHGPEAQPQVNESDEAPKDQFSKPIVLEYLSQKQDNLKSALAKATESGNTTLAEAIERSITRLTGVLQEIENTARLNVEAVERDVTAIENLLLLELQHCLSKERKEALEEEGSTQLKAYKKTMSKEAYKTTLANYVDKRARELHGIPRLSLFYMF
jgi:hypothetical protein